MTGLWVQGREGGGGGAFRYERWITRAMLRAEPDTLFVFGDNLQRRGLGGQAKEMRGEPNAVGIPTKKAPSGHPTAFFSDQDSFALQSQAREAFERLREHVCCGGKVVWPADGIGTGLADLPRRAPRLWAWFETNRRQIEITALAKAQPEAQDGRDG